MYDYPIYMKSRINDKVIKFTSLNKGTVIVQAHSVEKVGTTCDFVAHTNTSVWEHWDHYDYDGTLTPKLSIFKKDNLLQDLLLINDQRSAKFAFNVGLNGKTVPKFTGKTPIILCAKEIGYNQNLVIWEEMIKRALTADQFAAKYGLFIEEPSTDVPLLSDLLKEHGAYKKFLTNLSIGYKGYVKFVSNNSYDGYDYIQIAFCWSDTTEPEYWADLADTLESVKCVNDIRAPNDINYWLDQLNKGHTVWVHNKTLDTIKEYNKFNHPRHKPDIDVNFYIEEPTWLKHKSEQCDTIECESVPITKETTMKHVLYQDERPKPPTLQELLAEIFEPKQITDLCDVPKWIAHVFDENGDLESIVAIDSDEAALTMLTDNARELLGYTIRTYKAKSEHRLEVPVSTTKA